MTLPAGWNRLLAYWTNVEGRFLEMKKNDLKVFGFCVQKPKIF